MRRFLRVIRQRFQTHGREETEAEQAVKLLCSLTKKRVNGPFLPPQDLELEVVLR